MRIMPLLLIFVLLVTAAATGLAEQEEQITITGTFSGEATILPEFGSRVSLNLSFGYADFSLTSITGLRIIPGISGTQSFRLEYQHDLFTLGTRLNLALIPPAFQSLHAYAKACIFSVTLADEAFSLDANLRVDTTVLPAFSGTSTLTMIAVTGPLTARSITRIGLPPAAVEIQLQRFTGEWDFLETTLGEGDGAPTLTGDLGATYTIIPAPFAGNLWFRLSLAQGGITATSRTELELAPAFMESVTQRITIRYTLEGVTLISTTNFAILPAAGFTSQRVRAEIRWENLVLHAQATFAPAADPTVLIGFRYSFP